MPVARGRSSSVCACRPPSGSARAQRRVAERSTRGLERLGREGRTLRRARRRAVARSARRRRRAARPTRSPHPPRTRTARRRARHGAFRVRAAHRARARPRARRRPAGRRRSHAITDRPGGSRQRGVRRPFAPQAERACAPEAHRGFGRVQVRPCRWWPKKLGVRRTYVLDCEMSRYPFESTKARSPRVPPLQTVVTASL